MTGGLVPVGYILVAEGGQAFERAINSAVEITGRLNIATTTIARTFTEETQAVNVAAVALEKIAQAGAQQAAQELALIEIQRLGIDVEENRDAVLAAVTAAFNELTAATLRQAQAEAQLQIDLVTNTEAAADRARAMQDEAAKAELIAGAEQQLAAALLKEQAAQDLQGATTHARALADEAAKAELVAGAETQLATAILREQAAQDLQGAIVHANALRDEEAQAALVAQAESVLAERIAAESLAKEQATAATKYYIEQEAALVKALEAEAAAQAKAAQAQAAKVAGANSIVTGAGSATLSTSLGLDSSAISNAVKLAEALGLATAGSIALGVAMGGVGVAIGILKGAFDILGNVIQGIISVIQTLIGLVRDALTAAFNYAMSVIQNYTQAVQTAALITAASVAIITGVSIDLAAKYQDALNVVRTFSIAGSANVQELDANMKALNETITKIGTTTTVSMLNAAKASEDLVRAGVDVKEQTEGVLKAVVDLTIASAGELKAVDAANAVAVALHAYGIEAKDATQITNALTAAAQYSPASFSNMVNALKYVAPEAHLVGLSIQDTTAALALLANAGVVGSIAGTNLRQMLVSLEKPSETAREVLNKYGVSLYDAAGATRPFIDVIGDLNKAFSDQAVAAGKITEAERNWALETAFTVRGAHAAIILLNEGTAAFDSMTQAANNTSAALVAQLLMQPLAERVEIAKNAIEAMGISLGTGFLPILGAASNAVITFIGSWDISQLQVIGTAVQALLTNSGWDQLRTNIENAFAGDVAANIDKIIDLLQTIGTVVQTMILPALGNLKDAILEPFKDIGQVDTFAGAIDNLRLTIINLAIEVTKVIDFITNLVKAFNDSGDAGASLRAIIVGLITIALSPLILAVGLAIAAFVTLVGIAYIVGEVMFGNTKIVNDAAGGWDNFLKHLETVFPATASLLRAMGDLAGAVADLAVSWIKNMSSLAQGTLEAFKSVLNIIATVSGALGSMPHVGPLADAETDAMLKLSDAANRALGAMQGTDARLAKIQADVDNVKGKIQAAGDEIGAIHINILDNSTANEEFPQWLKDAAIGAQTFVADLQRLNQTVQDNNDVTPTAAGNNDNFKKALDNAAGANGGGAKGLKTELDSLIATTRTLGDEAEHAGRKFSESMQAAFDKLTKTDLAAQVALDKATRLAREAADRAIDAIYAKDTQGELDKQRVQSLKDHNTQIETNFKTHQDHLLKIEEDTLKDAATVRKQHIQDQIAEFKLTTDAAIRAQTDQNSIADRAAARSHQTAASALGDRQRLEEQALADRLKAQDQAAVTAEKLAQAKTPDERAKILLDASNQRAADERQVNNQKQLDALRTRHEQEAAALKVSQDEEDFRRKAEQEKKLAVVRFEAERQLREYGRILNAQETAQEQKDNQTLQLDKESSAVRVKTLQQKDAKDVKDLEALIAGEKADRDAQKIRDTLNNVTLPNLVKEYDARVLVNQGVYDDDVKRASQALTDKLQDIDDRWARGVAAAIEKGGIQLQGPIDTYTKILVDHLNSIKQAAEDATKAIKDQIAAASGKPASDSDSNGGSGGGEVDSTNEGGGNNAAGQRADNSGNGAHSGGNGGADRNYQDAGHAVESHALGGIVSGVFGQAKLIMAHAGERVLTPQETGAYHELMGGQSVLTVVRALKSAQPSQVVTNSPSTTYQVNANYSNSQSPSSVKMDMHALVAASKH